MQWTDIGIVIGCRRHGENSVILQAFTKNHGRHLGLVRSGRSRGTRGFLQTGNLLQLSWRARLHAHLGQYVIDPLEARAAKTMRSAIHTFGVQSLSELLQLLPEREPNIEIFYSANHLLSAFDDTLCWVSRLARFEMLLLGELGFGLDLTQCAAGLGDKDLAYISPRTGRAVSKQAGQAYADKLFPLPPFFLDSQEESPGMASIKASQANTVEELQEAFAITSHFLDRHIWGPQALNPPLLRRQLIQNLHKLLKREA